MYIWRNGRGISKVGHISHLAHVQLGKVMYSNIGNSLSVSSLYYTVYLECGFTPDHWCAYYCAVAVVITAAVVQHM